VIAGTKPAGMFGKLDAVGDGAEGAGKIMADARTDEPRQVSRGRARHGPRPQGAEMKEINEILSPGMLVRNPDRPDWGLGQVQSRIGSRITVNFENTGKVVVNGAEVALVPADDG